MKNEPWIDRVYKEKTESWNPPFNATHWEGAAALIDEQERNKRKRILWFWFAGLVLSGLLLIAFLQFRNQDVIPQELQTPKPVAEPMASQPTPAPSTPTENLSKDRVNSNGLATTENKNNLTVPPLAGIQHQNSIKNNSGHISSEHAKGKRQTAGSTLQSTQNTTLIAGSTQHSIIDTKEELVFSSDEGFTKSGRTIFETNGIQTLPASLDYPEELLPLPELFEPIQVTITNHRWKEFGLRVGLAKQTQTVRTNAISALGLEMYSQRQLGNKGYWGLSLGYNSFFNSSLYSEVLTAYQFKGFGSVVQNFGIKPEWMHYLYVQASMGIQLKKHRAFIGAKPELLLGALGKVDQLKFKEGSGVKDLATAEISSIGNGWLQKGALHQVLVNTQLGYEYQFHPKISVGLQANRHLNSLYKPLPGDVAQSNIAKWNIGMRVSYKIK